MGPEPEPRPWFEFRVEETEGLGVEAAKLSRLLQDMSSAFYAIARAKLGKEAARPGRRTPDEDALAAIRIVRILPGSAVIEAEPPVTGLQGQLALADQATAEDVLFDFALETRRLAMRQRSAFGRPEVRRRVQAVLKDAGELGRFTELVIRPRGSRSPVPLEDNELRVRIATEETKEVTYEPERRPRQRLLSGHAYMVDVEPGRMRIRLKLPDGRDITLDADPDLIPSLRGAVDRVVEIEAVEELEGDQVASRTAVHMALLPSSGIGSEKPPKSIEELAQEQGLTGKLPDYLGLATAVWETEEQVAEFAVYLSRVRQAASSQG